MNINEQYGSIAHHLPCNAPYIRDNDHTNHQQPWHAMALPGLLVLDLLPGLVEIICAHALTKCCQECGPRGPHGATWGHMAGGLTKKGPNKKSEK